MYQMLQDGNHVTNKYVKETKTISQIVCLHLLKTILLLLKIKRCTPLPPLQKTAQYSIYDFER